MGARGSRSSRAVHDGDGTGELKLTPPIAVHPSYETKTTIVMGKRMAYVEAGSGDPIVFVHGNPTSKYMWRNVMPHCESVGRVIAVDLIGMGESEKLDKVQEPDRYSLKEQSKYFSAFLEAVGIRENVTLVGHSWGGTLAAHWGSLHQDQVRGMVCMEVVYVPFPSWERVPDKIRAGVKLLKRTSPVCCCCCAFDVGAHLILKKNLMIKSMPERVQRELRTEELNYYTMGFEEPGESRRPILSFIRSIPVAGEPAEVVDIMDSGRAWLEGASDLPILFLSVEPGTMMPGDRDFIRGLKNVTEISVPGGHMVAEDSPDLVGQAIANWLRDEVSSKVE